MPRNIMLPEQQQNSKDHLKVNSKGEQKRSSACSNCSNFSDEDTMLESKWRTNLLITQDQDRVHRRDQGYRKNTSFQNKIINDHIKVMIECVTKMEGYPSVEETKNICNLVSSQQTINKQGIVAGKIQSLIQENTYLTEDEKGELVKLFTQNYDNYQILLKTVNRLQETCHMREELVFILGKVVEFITHNYELKLRKYDQKFMEDQISKRLPEVSKLIVGHKNIKIINPEYFYNSNEKKYMRVIQVWLYCVFAIKLGIYGNKYLQGEDMELQM